MIKNPITPPQKTFSYHPDSDALILAAASTATATTAPAMTAPMSARMDFPSAITRRPVRCGRRLPPDRPRAPAVCCTLRGCPSVSPLDRPCTPTSFVFVGGCVSGAVAALESASGSWSAAWCGAAGAFTTAGADGAAARGSACSVSDGGSGGGADGGEGSGYFVSVMRCMGILRYVFRRECKVSVSTCRRACARFFAASREPAPVRSSIREIALVR